MSRFGMCLIAAVLLIAGVDVAEGQTLTDQPQSADVGEGQDGDEQAVHDPHADEGLFGSPRRGLYRGLRMPSRFSPEGLEKLLSEGRWDAARQSMRKALSQGWSNTPSWYNTPIIPKGTSKPLLPENRDPMYLALEKDVRAELKTGSSG